MIAMTRLIPTRALALSCFFLLSTTLLGFRVSVSENIDQIALQLSHWATIFICGFSFSLAERHVNKSNMATAHIHLLAMLLGGGSALGVLQLISIQSLWAIAALPVAALLSLNVSRQVLKESPRGNFALAFWLAILILMWVFSYLSSLSSEGWFHIAYPPLLGKITTYASSAWLLPLILISIFVLYFLLPSSRSEVSLILIGIGLVIAGPLVLLGWLAAELTKLIEPGRRTNKALSDGLIGGALLCFLAAASKHLFGGYAPPLGFAILITSIPFLLLWNQHRLQGLYPSTSRRRIESLMIGISVILVAMVLFHLNQFVEGV